MLTTVKTLYQNGDDFMPAFRHLHKWDSEGLRKAIQKEDPWWGIVYRYVSHTIHSDDVIPICEMLSRPAIHVYDSLLQHMLLSVVRHHPHYSKEALVALLTLIKERPLDVLFQTENTYSVSLFKDFKRDVFHYDLAFGPLFDALTTFYQPHHWMEYIQSMVKNYVKTDKNKNHRLNISSYARDNFELKIHHLKTVWPSLETAFIAKAWADNSGAFRYFYYYVEHGSEPFKQSISTSYFKEQLYEKFQLAFNNKSRIEELLRQVDASLHTQYLEEELFKLIVKDKTVLQPECNLLF